MMLYVGKQGSVNVAQPANTSAVWDNQTGIVTLTAKDAKNYPITITPTNNYCWKDADNSSVDKPFIFRIAPIKIDALQMELKQNIANQEFWAPVGNIKNGAVQIYEKDTARTIRIGDGSDSTLTSYNDEWHFFTVINDVGEVIADPNKLTNPDYGVVCSVGNGYLNFSAVNAGVYRIRVTLRNANYSWIGADSVDGEEEEDGTSITYKLTITAAGIPVPTLNKPGCSGNQSTDKLYDGSHDDCVIDWAHMHGVYYDTDFVLAVSLSHDYASYIKVEILKEGETSESDKVFTEWTADGVLLFTARGTGRHTVRLSVNDPNYEWKDKEYYDFSIEVALAPIAGVEAIYSSEGVPEKTYTRDNGFYDGAEVTLNKVTYNGKEHKVDLNRVSAEGLIHTTFKAQYEIEVTYRAVLGDAYTTTLLNTSVSDESCEITFVEAGIYTISVKPAAQYCWKSLSSDDTQFSKKPVIFTVEVEQRKILAPQITDVDPDTGSVIGDNTLSETFKSSTMPVSLWLALNGVPEAYSIKLWEPLAGTNGKTDGMSTTLGTDYVSGSVTGVNGDTGIDADNDRLKVKATYNGTYYLTVVLSNLNNYAWDETSAVGYDFYLVIKKRGVDIPEAYLTSKDVTYEQLIQSIADNDPVGKKFDGNSQSVDYDGDNHLIYVIGDSVADGAFNIEPKTDANGAIGMTSGYRTENGDPAGANDIKYWMFSAKNRATYNIEFTFKSEDYEWKGGSSSERDIEFTINARRVDIPQFVMGAGETVPTLVDGAYHVEKPFNYGNFEMAVSGGKFGPYDSATGKYLYLNVAVASVSSPDYTNFTIGDEDANGARPVTMNTNGCPKSADYASAAIKYCLEFTIDENNEVWHQTSDTAPKYFYIDVKKVAVSAPVLETNMPGASAAEFTQFSRTLTYTGSDWNAEIGRAHV